MQDKLISLGFSANGALVYLALLELRKARAGTIIAHTKIHRHLVYQALRSLEAKGLVYKVLSRGVAVFEANDPRRLVEMVDEERARAAMVVKELARLQEAAPRDIAVLEGDDGARRIQERSLETDAVYLLGGSDLRDRPELATYWRTYDRKRARKKLKLRALYDRSATKDLLNRENKLPETQAKYLPFGLASPAWFEMFGDQLAIGIPGADPLVFSIRSKEASQSMKQYFEFLWNQKIRVERGVEAMERAFYDMTESLNPGERYYVLGASTGWHAKRHEKFFDEYHAFRIRKGVAARLLVYRGQVVTLRNRFILCGDPQFTLSEVKPFLNDVPNPLQINLYHNKVVLIIYEDDPIVIHVDEPRVYEGLKAYFDELWRTAKI